MEWNAAPLDGDDCFPVTMEVLDRRDIADPHGSEPGATDVEFQVDGFFLFGGTGRIFEEDRSHSANDSAPYIRT